MNALTVVRRSNPVAAITIAALLGLGSAVVSGGATLLGKRSDKKQGDAQRQQEFALAQLSAQQQQAALVAQQQQTTLFLGVGAVAALATVGAIVYANTRKTNPRRAVRKNPKRRNKRSLCCACGR